MKVGSEIKKIAVLAGDGIGAEVAEAAVWLLEQLGLPLSFQFGDIGWRYWQQEGAPLPDRTWQLINNSDAVLLGATTSMAKREAELALPEQLRNKGLSYVSPIIQLRQGLDLYANVRPCFSIKPTTKPFNFAVIRENSEGLYAGLDYYPVPDELRTLLRSNDKWQARADESLAASIRLQSQSGLERIFKFAFAYAIEQGVQKVTLADKPNVLRNSSDFARQIFESTAASYPTIKAEILNVDAVALWMVQRPESFGVIVAENMFGDILSDLGAGIMGGLGLAPSANIGEQGAYFEPVHGSAPNIQSGRANPCAMLLSCVMMLKHLGLIKPAQKLAQAVQQVIKEGQILTYDLGGEATTMEVVRAIVDIYAKPK